MNLGILTKPVRAVGRRVLNPAIPVSEYLRNPPHVTRAWREVNRRHLTYSPPGQLSMLMELIRDIERRQERGEIIETGCALGGSAILMCATKSKSRPMRVFDVFGMIPPPSSNDGDDMQQRYKVIAEGKSDSLGGNRYYAYEEDLQGKVRDNFAVLGFPCSEHNVSFVAGKVQDTLTVNGPVVLAHIDVDWFEPVAACLERIVPNLSPNGALILRAYSDWSGCRKATDEYFAKRGHHGFTRSMVDGALLLRRTGH